MKHESKDNFTVVKSRSLWTRIDSLLNAHHLSKKELANICSVRPSAITKWVSGGGIDAVNIAKIAVHFSVTSDWIIGIDDASNTTTLSHLPPSNFRTHGNFTPSLTPVKKVKISALREDTETIKAVLEKLAKAVADMEKRIGELEKD